MEIVEITANKAEILVAHIQPNVIINRYDLRFGVGGGWKLFCVQDEQETVYIAIHFKQDVCELTTYLRPLKAQILKMFSRYLFKHYPQINAVYIYFALLPYKGLQRSIHWHIEFPLTFEAFAAKLGARTRQHTHYYMRKLERDFEGLDFFNFTPQSVDMQKVQTYLDWKKDSHGFECATPKEYLKRFSVTRIYTLENKMGLVAIGFVSETGENAYFENFSYDLTYSKYSPGMVLYYKILQDLCARGIRKFYLLGGSYSYKKNYNGIQSTCYSGYICRYQLLYTFCMLIPRGCAKLRLPHLLRKCLVYCLNVFIRGDVYRTELRRALI